MGLDSLVPDALVAMRDDFVYGAVGECFAV